MNPKSTLRCLFETAVRAGKTPAEAAAALGLTRDQRYRWTHLMGLPKRGVAISAIARARVDRGIKIGSVDMTLRQHDYAFGKWLTDATPNGATIAETLVAIAVDAYHHETGKQDAAHG